MMDFEKEIELLQEWLIYRIDNFTRLELHMEKVIDCFNKKCIILEPSGDIGLLSFSSWKSHVKKIK